jgi:Pyridoxamine 5'-phosphate oxidase
LAFCPKDIFRSDSPLSQQGHVNCSPKDGRSFQILDQRTVVYLDLTGSGVETIAHVTENGRIVLMFCAFSGAPNIVRLHGQGEVIESHHGDFLTLKERFGNVPGLRSFIRVRLTRVSTSCGFGVPLYEFVGDRNQLAAWAEHKGTEKLVEYQHEKNAISIDGLRGIAHTER